MHHILDVKDEEDYVLLTVTHAHKTNAGEMIGHGQTTITIKRVAGKIGFGRAQVSVEQWTGGAQRTLESLGVQL